jgi:hypothetical protein
MIASAEADRVQALPTLPEDVVEHPNVAEKGRSSIVAGTSPPPRSVIRRSSSRRSWPE